jgi:tetratricopeptide (TPR) repeat protein
MGFKEFAVQVARGVGPNLDWEKPPEPKPGTDLDKALAEWTKAHPTNYYSLRQSAQRAIATKDWKAAKTPLLQLIELFPTQGGAESAWPQLALVHRSLGETNEERQVLTRAAALDHESPDVYLRLMELAAAVRDWPTVLTNANRFLAVNPLVPAPYRYLAEASEATGQADVAISAYRTLLQLDPPNPADTHFQLARLLQPANPTDSRRHVLQALEEAPRHRPALRLLLQLQGKTAANAADPK